MPRLSFSKTLHTFCRSAAAILLIAALFASLSGSTGTVPSPGEKNIPALANVPETPFATPVLQPLITPVPFLSPSHTPPQTTPMPAQNRIGSVYRFSDLEKDIEYITARYKDIAHCSRIGTTAGGRAVYCIEIGYGSRKILITAGTHARENANTPMLMQTVFNLLQACYDEDKAAYYNLPDLMQKVRFVIVPLVNPDGYERSVSENDGKIKTNLNGVDINRNFPCKYWGSRLTLPGNGYPGKFPASENETQAIIRLFEQHHFSLALDLHSRGREIICRKNVRLYEEKAPNNDPDAWNAFSLRLARVIKKFLPYKILKETRIKRGEEGTLTDFAFSRGVPTITLETLSVKVDPPASPEQIKEEYGLCDWTQLLCVIARNVTAAPVLIAK
ncbi:MAG: M14 family metallopeptidase [Christensenellales bacterium]